MNGDLFIGLASLTIAVFLTFVALPNKDGESPRFLRFETAVVLYPPLVMVLFAAGVAELISAYLRIR